MSFFFTQTFDLLDLLRLFLLFFLEILLSADNAIVLGLIVRQTAPALRQKALLIGLFSAFLFRGAALFSLSFVFQFFWIKAAGAAYLLYLSLRYFFFPRRPSFKEMGGFWKTVLFIELFDLAFAMDSIVAGLAFIGPNPISSAIHPKLWVVYAGTVLGMIVIRFAARLFSTLLDHFPLLERSAYLMIAWIALKLLLPTLPFTEPVFWAVLVLLFISGFRKVKSND